MTHLLSELEPTIRPGRVPPTVSVIVPALNEENCIDWVFEHIPSWVSEVVLVDGLSTDLTEAVARSKRPDILVVHQRRRGRARRCGPALRQLAAISGSSTIRVGGQPAPDPKTCDRRDAGP